MVVGQHHRVSPQYLYQFANEAARKGNRRRLSNREMSRKKLALAMAQSGLGIGGGRWLEKLSRRAKVSMAWHSKIDQDQSRGFR